MTALTMKLVLHLILLLIIYSCVKSQNNSSIEENTNFTLIESMNETLNSTENIADDNSLTTETPITTTLEPLTTTPEPSEDDAFRYYAHSSDDYCTCDLRLQWCDIDCCCDNDCNDSERSAFGECIQTRNQIYDRRYCHNRNIVYINNTKTTVEKSSNGLFCIVWDNSNEKHLFEDIKPINDLNKILNITPQHNYSWAQKSVRKALLLSESEIFKSDFKMKSGKNLLISKVINETKIDSIWELPNSMIIKDGECNSFIPVKYLKDFDSKCYRLIRNLSEECLNSKYLSVDYYKTFHFISKNFLNQSDTNLVIIDITSDMKYDEPVIDSSTKECKNVVKFVDYVIYHNGSNGIIDANLKVEFTQLKPNTKWFEQSFSVTFLWFNKSIGIDLSGNPGYILGKPIVAAFMAKDNTNLTKVFNGYQIMTQNNNGFCDLNSTKESIKFGINLKSGCLLRLKYENEDNFCESIQKTILKLLEPESLINYIGVFGNASTQVSNDWIRVLDVDNTSSDPLNDNLCPILVTGISLHFYYVNAGHVQQPQHKIVGLVKRYHSQTDVIVKCQTSTAHCNHLIIELSSSVSFYDITKPSRPEYAPPVTFKIQLPSDFFYPFLTNSHIILSPNYKHFLIFCSILYPYLSSQVFYSHF